ncbi:basic amino acid/polyamine antiporter [Celerinatantimonas yamalensis]|uniref:Basic amino acid/polyamine antiporter n=1 Tax=Celerinatantimonas yamalensis TaxID=559956 RepID=A0ABW9G2S5_9GAMM
MDQKKIGLLSLTALVFSSMVGSGIFSLPQNMAEVSGLKAELIAWLITGVGILSLAGCFLLLSRLRPDLDEGIYSYAREGFGDLMGFFSAWGYWLCSTIGVVAYLVVAFSALGGLLDSPHRLIFGAGNTWPSFVGESLLLWMIHTLVSRGVRQAALFNLLGSLAKTIPLLIFIVIVAYCFKPTLFSHDINGVSLDVPIANQVKHSMLITLWVFTGIEGAVVLSARAQNKRDIGRATFIGVLFAAFLYISISLLSRGIMPREQIAALTNPSMAGILADLIGGPGKLLVSLGVLVSVLASYISWILYATEVPQSIARHHAFPKIFAKLNANGVSTASLWLTSITVQICLVMLLFSGKGYNTLVRVSTSMILVPYLLVGLYLLKVSLQTKPHLPMVVVALGASSYGVWLLYAAGLDGVLLSILLYVPGMLIFLYSRRQNEQRVHFNLLEKGLIGVLLLAMVPAINILLF